MPNSSRIFVQNRAIGYVSNHVPAVTRFIKCRKQNVIVTCVGRCFHTYDSAHLGLLTVSDSCENDITCLAADSRLTFVAAGNDAFSFKRGTTVFKSYKGHLRPIHLLLPFGAHLITVDESNLLKVWERNSGEHYLELTFDESTFKISTINHPSTYLNKIILGSEQGTMQLWNIKTSKLVYSFDGWQSPILVLEQAPALDVVAVGLSSGKIILHNLKYDESLMDFTQDWGPVTAISFRTDGPPIMATGTTVGHVVFWNLEEKKVTSQLLNSHNGPVGCVKFFPNEPLLITSSEDNSLKMWIFDLPDDCGRLLRLREGHGAQPTHVRFHGNNGFYIMSSGSDSSLRVFSTVRETYNYSLGKASFNRKAVKKKNHLVEKYLMPPIIEFTSEITRDKEWDSIASIHSGLPIVTTWSFYKRKMGELKLLPKRFAKKTRACVGVVATCLTLTSCGNFVIIGYSSGHADRFNIQSGIHRCQYGDPVAHKSSVKGVTSDNLSQMVITGCSSGLIKFWDFKGSLHSNICSKPLSKLNLQESIAFFRIHKDSILLAVILEDYDIVLLDTVTKTIVRRLSGHNAVINDAAFSPDCRWLISASMDSTIRTWDLPNCALVDIFKVHSPCTSLAMSPSGHLLATIHVNSLGIYLWFNKTLYDEVILQPIKSDIQPTLGLPLSRGKEGVTQLDDDEILDDDKPNYGSMKSPEQIDSLITLSGQSTSRWLNLLDIDLIRKKNRPKENFEVAEKAPFFLPTILSSNDVKFDFSATTSANDSIRNLKLKLVKNYTVFGNLLEKTSETNDYSLVVEKIKVMGPSSIDSEIHAMALEAQGSEILLMQFMKVINFMMSSHKDFELAQSYLSLFLKVHGQSILSNSDLKNYLLILQEKQAEMWNKIQSDMLYLLSVLDFYKKV